MDINEFEKLADNITNEIDSMNDEEFLNFALDLGYTKKENEDNEIHFKKEVLKQLKEDGLRLKYYSEAVKNDFECITTAMESNYHAYDAVGEKYKLDNNIINLYWDEYIKEQDNINEYVDYYPEELTRKF